MVSMASKKATPIQNPKAFSQAVAEFATYIEHNAHAIPN